MAEYQLSRKAKSGLRSIADFTIQRFGIRQARKYRDLLSVHFGALARNPMLGREVGWLVSGLHRSEIGSHVVFYRVEESRIFVVRILHESMDALRHL